ncbi:isopentenyl-diphosphate Delta-isomerase [Pantoea sp. Aalb]|uniref:isopentenyl-diphosphate Delta-isomerase n=1 Tax=Pantoea sp. Aalb TaxID=2576762 RepID=UPI0013245294|nr:isopentenyl-diphosphate Delta-isomerase [Pantoea sp. Aalb]MXP67513.1 isopentenyl-diphosphate Delta-isomerase [Pantoea sp. Aalb]
MSSVVEVILVDYLDRPTGTMEKIEAHTKGLLHRAVTIYVFNSRYELLLQRRASKKYHCAGLWSNTCCSHPYPQEDTHYAAERRLSEEMGLQLILSPVMELNYNLILSNGLIEHEYSHVFFVISDKKPQINFNEADAWCYRSIQQIQQETIANSSQFTPWFLHTFPRIPHVLNNFSLINR